MLSIIKDNNISIKVGSSIHDDWEDQYIDDDDERCNFTDITYYFNKYIINPEKEYMETETSHSTCRMNGVEKIRPDKRHSYTYSWKYILKSDKVNQFLESNKIRGLDFFTYEGFCGTDYMSYKSKFELIKYEKGGLFIKHKDKLYGEPTCEYIHTHMCLLYPPVHLSPFEGGDIIFYLKNDIGEEITRTIKPSEFTDWTFIIFERPTLHEVLPITKGERYVYKTQLYTKNPNYDDREEQLDS